MSKPIAYDLCCGDGGWAHGLIAVGWHVIGYDIVQRPNYPGEFRLQDILLLDGNYLRNGALIVASPPCEEFSRHQMPWTKRRNPPEPSLALVNACWRIAKEAGLPIVLENVRKSQDWIGRARYHAGPFYLFGDVPPLMPNAIRIRKKESYGSKDLMKRAMVPREVAEWIGRIFMPRYCQPCDVWFDQKCGKYGCPNCMGESVYRDA